MICIGNRLFVGNIPFTATDEDLKNLFLTVGDVTEVKIVRYQDTGKSRGFGFVEMRTKELAEKAIEILNGKTLKVGESERNLLVTEAKAK